MDWFFCEPQRNADYNSCNPCSLSSCEIEQPGALQAQDDSSKIQNSAAYFVRRGFDVPAANQRATPKTWNHDFTDFVRKDTVNRIEHEFHSHVTSSMLLCNKKIDEAGKLVMNDSQHVADSQWKVVDVNECFCKSLHVSRSQIRFKDWLKLCGRATESKSLLKITQIMSRGIGTPSVSIVLYGGRQFERPFLVEVSFDPVFDSMSHVSNYLVRFKQCIVPDAALLQHIKSKNDFKWTDLQALSMTSELIASSEALQAMRRERATMISQDQQETRRSQDKLATVGYVIKKHSNQTKFVVQDNPLSPSSGGGSPRKKLDGVPSLKK